LNSGTVEEVEVLVVLVELVVELVVVFVLLDVVVLPVVVFVVLDDVVVALVVEVVELVVVDVEEVVVDTDGAYTNVAVWNIAVPAAPQLAFTVYVPAIQSAAKGPAPPVTVVCEKAPVLASTCSSP
jgi:hypothetical protein